MAANPQPQVKKRAVKQSAWKALASQYKTVAKLHLRRSFRRRPQAWAAHGRGGRGDLPRLFQESCDG